jgi:hypothetical protein
MRIFHLLRVLDELDMISEFEILCKDVFEQILGRVCIPGAVPVHDFVENHRERPHVRFRVVGLVLENFRRHVQRSPNLNYDKIS